MKDIYQRIIQDKNYSFDSQQLALLEALNQFNSKKFIHNIGSTIKNIFTKQKKPYGLYVYGKVGRGKTFILNLFFENLPLQNKRKDHFHSFMLDCHKQIKNQKNTQEDVINNIVREFKKKYTILFLDEFFISNIADAMLLSRLITEFAKAGIIILLTSNLKPDQLYLNGLKREYILPFIDFIQKNFVLFDLDGKKDYRLQKIYRELYIYPLAKNQKKIQEIIISLTNDKLGLKNFKKKKIQSSDNRSITLNYYYNNIVYIDFSEICDDFVGTADYIAISNEINAIIINKIPQLKAECEDQALRFINLVDCLYNKKIIVYFIAEVPLKTLYTGIKFKNDFLRTSSRIIEIQSEEYLIKSKLITKN